MSTKIQWCDETWNPIVGCSKISDGCMNCYAEKQASRGALQQFKRYREVITDGKWNGKFVFHRPTRYKPYHWKKPRNIFVCSMSDLFLHRIPFGIMKKIFATIEDCPQHNFIVLTKRTGAMYRFFWAFKDKIDFGAMKNLWIGASVENNKHINRISNLCEIKKWIGIENLFVSLEPLLELISYLSYHELKYDKYRLPLCVNAYLSDIKWVIVGGESGANARPIKAEWVRIIRDQCKKESVPFFFKQWGKYKKGNLLDGKKYEEFPEELINQKENE